MHNRLGPNYAFKLINFIPYTGLFFLGAEYSEWLTAKKNLFWSAV